MYGAQTLAIRSACKTTFENDVEMYGAQTFYKSVWNADWFENDVEMYGAQTRSCAIIFCK